MSFNYKLSWIQLSLTLLLGGYYAFTVLTLASDSTLNDAVLASLLIQLVIIMVVFHVVIISVTAILNIADASRGDDERDTLISLQGDRVAYYTLSSLFMALMFTIVIGKFDALHFFTQLSTEFSILHVMFISFISAEILKCTWQLVCYLRG